MHARKWKNVTNSSLVLEGIYHEECYAQDTRFYEERKVRCFNMIREFMQYVKEILEHAKNEKDDKERKKYKLIYEMVGRDFLMAMMVKGHPTDVTVAEYITFFREYLEQCIR
jgi:hypothetical protein